MRKVLQLLLVLSALPLYASELYVRGGILRIGGKLTATRVNINEGALLGGNGIIDAPSFIEGTVAPGSASPTDTDTLTFTTSLTFVAGSVYSCHATTHTNSDQIVAYGSIGGEGHVQMSKASNAIPLEHIILNGDTASSFVNIYLTNPNKWRLTTEIPGNLLITDLEGDSDGDTIPDYWEIDHFGSRTNCTPALDSDGDAMTDADEFIALTDPHSATSFLAVTEVNTASSTNIIITWNSVSQRNYALYRTTNLVNAVYTNIATDIPGVPPKNSYTNEIKDGTTYFYVIKVSQP